MTYKPTKALRKIAKLRKPIKGIQGGQGAGKTISILMLIINHLIQNPNKEVFILSAELTKMRNTVIKDFVKLMRDLGYYQDKNFTSGTLYRFDNNSFIKFIGLDKEDVGKGLRCDIAFINEANKCSFESIQPILSRARITFMDWNPDNEFWFHRELLGTDDVDYIELTFRDNEYLPASEVKQILGYYQKGFNEDGSVKNRYWANKARVYGDGLIGMVDGAIFENWEIFKQYPEGEYIRLWGIDWGEHDPTTLTELRFYKDYPDDIYIREHFYKPLKDLTELINKIKNVVPAKEIIIADCAGKDKILELLKHGIKALKSDKSQITSKGSIIDGIDILQQYNLKLWYESTNLITEHERYAWAKDKFSGEFVPVPIDIHNHLIDPQRYCARWYHLYLRKVKK